MGKRAYRGLSAAVVATVSVRASAGAVSWILLDCFALRRVRCQVPPLGGSRQEALTAGFQKGDSGLPFALFGLL